MNKNFTLKYLLLLIISGTTIKGFTQVNGDFQTKNASGNWSDFNSWNVYSGGVWIPAIPGEIPTSINSVYVQTNQTVNVDNSFAICKDLNITNGGSPGKIAFTTSSGVLNVTGNFNLTSSGICFGMWTAGAKIVFSGSVAQSLSGNLTVASVFENIEVNEPLGGSLTTNSNFRFGSFTLTSGNFIVGTGYEIQGSSSAATITINGGTWTQNSGNTKINNSGMTTTPIGALIINGSAAQMILGTTATTGGFQFTSIDVLNGGILTVQKFTAPFTIATSINIDASGTFNTALVTTPLPSAVTFDGVVNYNNTGAQDISQANYSYLRLSGTGTKTIKTGTTITIPANGTLEMSGSGPATLNLAATGTLAVSGFGTNLLYTATVFQTATFNEWNTNFQNITVNNSAGVSMAGLARTITGSLNLTNGTFNLGAGGYLTMDGSPLNRINGYIAGTSTSDFTITGTTGGTILLPLSADINLQNITIDGTRQLLMDGSHNINLYGAFNIGATGIYDNGGESVINKGGASPSVIVDGKFITKDVEGLYYYNTTPTVFGAINANNMPAPVLNIGSTVEYGLAGDQIVQGSTVPDYYNVIFSGGGTKKLQSANIPFTITVLTTTIFNAQNFTFGSPTTTLTMTGISQYINGGSGTKPDAGGTYSLAPGTTIEFALASGTVVRLGSPINYANILVSGTNVSNNSTVTGIAFQPGGTFTVKTGATFNLKNPDGFSGGLKTSVSNTNNPAIILENGSTIGYTGSNQVITNEMPYQNLLIAGTGNKTAPSGTLTVQGDLTKSGTSTFLHNNGTVLLNGPGPQSFAGLTYNNLILTNGIKTTYGNSTIIDSIKINDGTTLSIRGIPDSITLHSDPLKTARIGQIGTGAINYNVSGKFVVERYIPARKAWRFLAVPTNSSQTIKEAWQEGATIISDDLKPTYGTIITSDLALWSTKGFDELSAGGPSVKTYNSITNAYDGILSTNATSFSSSAGGYFIFIRGDRSATAFASPVTSTTLRTSGQLYTGTQAGIQITNQFIPVNNPYASQIDLANLSTIPTYYAWDPNRGGNYGYGGFTTFSWNSVTGTFDTAPQNIGSYGSTNNFIDNGQAFLASTFGSPVTIQFTENVKTSSTLAISPFTPIKPPGQQWRSDLYALNNDGSSYIADGVLNTYSDNDNNDIDEKDAKKNNNPAENLSIERNDTLLAIERRQTLRAEDTIFFQVGKLSAKRNYRFVFTPNKIYESGLQPYLEDNYLNTKTDLHLTDTTRVSFFTDGTTGSTAFNRFRVVFDAAEGILPVTFTNVNAYTKNWEIAVEWQVENETGIKYYEVEKSTDETYFTSVVEVTAKNTAQGSKYTWTDVQPTTGCNYYRVKSVDNSGAIRYSKVVKVLMSKLAQGIHVYPNPLVNNTIQLEFVSMPAGKYEIQLINKLGQVIESKEIQHTGNCSGTEAVPIKAFAPHGVYRLEIIKPGGDKINSSLIY